ncbi:MAG TPA: plastocyanin/azurin family copper-binding protein [Thermoleophilaceae bacterium]|nr:plastocyanin/azurin family copper-binding protein [Thermoleophilaceae bacterium]
MRPQHLLIPLALLTPLVFASPAAALDWRVDATSAFTFEPPEPHIAVGDSVTWHFDVDGHTSTSKKGQPESWNSVSEGTNAAGSTFSHTFKTPGRYQYVCIPHQTFMKGVIQVGTDTVSDTLDNFRTRRRENRVTLSFRLNEPATVTYRLRGPSRRTVRRGRLAAGARSFTVRRLKRGSYRGVLTVVDDFDKKITPRNSFVIR